MMQETDAMTHADNTIPIAPFAIIGPGALGTLFAVRLTHAGIPVLLFDYLPHRAARLNETNFVLHETNGQRTVHVPVTADPSRLAEVQSAFVFVKAYRTEAVSALLADHLPSEATVLTLQNGLGNVELLQLHLGSRRVYGGATAQGALLLAPGEVRDMGAGPTAIGRLDGKQDAGMDILCRVLLQAGFPVSITDNLTATIWGKVLLNAAINPIGALLGWRNGQLVRDAAVLEMMVEVVEESYQVALASGVRVTAHDWRVRLQTIGLATAENVNSMLQDLNRGRRTEIEAINGAIVQAAQRLAIAAPLNAMLCALIQARERNG